MKFSVLRGNGYAQNTVFDLVDPANRDDIAVPFAALRARFAAADVHIDTADMPQPEPAIFELHQDVQPTPGTGR